MFGCILWSCGIWGFHLHSWVHLAAEHILLCRLFDGEECRSFSSQVVYAHLMYICWQGCTRSHGCKASALETSLEILYFRSSEGMISNASGPVCYAMFHSVRERKVSSQCFSNYPQGLVQRRRNEVLLTFIYFFFRELITNAAITSGFT